MVALTATCHEQDVLVSRSTRKCESDGKLGYGMLSKLWRASEGHCRHRGTGGDWENLGSSRFVTPPTTLIASQLRSVFRSGYILNLLSFSSNRRDSRLFPGLYSRNGPLHQNYQSKPVPASGESSPNSPNFLNRPI